MLATKADLISRFGEDELIELTDRDGSTGAIVDAALEVALDDASDIAMAYLGRYTAEQLATPPKALVKVVCDLARHALYDERIPETVEKRYSSAIKFLESLADGSVKLGVPDPEPEEQPVDAIEMESAGTLWGRSNSTGYV